MALWTLDIKENVDGGDAFLRVPELVDSHVQHHQHLQHPPASTQSAVGTIMTIIGWIDIEEHLDVRHCKLVIIETMCRSLSLSVPFDKKRHPLLQIHIKDSHQQVPHKYNVSPTVVCIAWGVQCLDCAPSPPWASRRTLCLLASSL